MMSDAISTRFISVLSTSVRPERCAGVNDDANHKAAPNNAPRVSETLFQKCLSVSLVL